jgi:hypothetical protein
VTGGTSSTNFPTTAGAFQSIYGGGSMDAFVTKLDPTGAALGYSTYLGGSGEEFQFKAGIAVDTNGNAYVTGPTSSTDFPTTAGAFQPAYGGGPFDAFVTKLDAAGSALVYSTYLGGSGNESRFDHALALDTDGNAYVAGATSSTDFPTTAGAFQSTYGGGFSDAFVTKLDPAGSSLVYSTYLGGIDDDRGLGIAVDAAGNAYVTGSTLSENFPTAGAFDTTHDGSPCSAFCTSDAFVTKLNPTGTGLVYSSFLGGNGNDSGNGTLSENFPTTVGAFDTTYGSPRPAPSSADAFVAKIMEDSIAPNTTAASSPAANAAGWNNSPVSVTLSATDNGGGSGVKSITYSVNAGAPVTVNGATASFTLSTEGVNTVSFNATDNAGNAEASQTRVVRIDQTPPSGTLSLSPPQLWPANHKLVTITPSLSVSDAGGGPVTASGPFVSSSEPVTGSGDGTSPDWVVSGDTLQLRAERAEGSSGRVYTVRYTLTDQAGNSAQASSTVTVSKSR